MGFRYTLEHILIIVGFVFSIATFILYAISFSCPYWINKEFIINVPGKYFDPPLAPVLSNVPIPIHVDSYMGVIRSCSKLTVKIPGFPDKTQFSCGSGGARHWQYVAGGFAIAALFLGFVSLTLSTLFLFMYRKTYFLILKCVVVFTYFLSAASVVVATNIYAANKNIQVKPPLKDKYDYDLGWAFYLAVISIVCYFLLFVLNLGMVFLTCSKSNKGLIDPTVRYKADDKTSP